MAGRDCRARDDARLTWRNAGITDPANPTERSAASTPESRSYIGERLDAEAGLQYLNARYYDPKLGMFIQPDWWEVTKAGVRTNRYAYAGGDSVNGIDPSGHLTLVVKGTNATDDQDDYVAGSSYLKEIEKSFKESPIVVEGVMDNYSDDRKAIAQRIFALVANHEFSEGEKLNIVTHSHGGNAVAYYTNMSEAKTIDTLVTLAMPRRSDVSLNMSRVRRHLNAYSDGDGVVGNAGGPDGSVFNIFKYRHADRTIPETNHAKNVDATYFPSSGEIGDDPQFTGHSDFLNPLIWKHYLAPELRGK